MRCFKRVFNREHRALLFPYEEDDSSQISVMFVQFLFFQEKAKNSISQLSMVLLQFRLVWQPDTSEVAPHLVPLVARRCGGRAVDAAIDCQARDHLRGNNSTNISGIFPPSRMSHHTQHNNVFGSTSSHNFRYITKKNVKTRYQSPSC